MTFIVILDSNVLLMPFQFNINLERELDRLLGSWEGVVPSTVMNELNGLARQDRNAKMALKLAERFRVERSKLDGDDGVVEVAVRLNGVPVTNDKELKKRFAGMGMAHIFMRGKNHLELSGEPSV